MVRGTEKSGKGAEYSSVELVQVSRVPIEPPPALTIFETIIVVTIEMNV